MIVKELYPSGWGKPISFLPESDDEPAPRLGDRLSIMAFGSPIAYTAIEIKTVDVPGRFEYQIFLDRPLERFIEPSHIVSLEPTPPEDEA